MKIVNEILHKHTTYRTSFDKFWELYNKTYL